jgi:Kdo2-lipid IVA lauroyltransferase/acyltransferase
MLTYLGYRLAELIAIMTPYPVTYFLASFGANLWYATGTNVGILKKNISIALKKNIGDPQISRIARKIFINWAKNVVDFLKHRVVSPDKLKERICLEGTENLDRALKKGKGAIIFTSHIGNFEWGACRIAAEGYSIWGVSLVRESQRTNIFFESKRMSKGLKTLYINRMLHVLRYLRNNEIIAVPSDWDPTAKSSRPFDFFGKKAYLPAGAVELALKSGAELLPSFIWRNGKYNHHQIIGEPVELERCGEKDELIDKNMKKVLPVMEKYISEHIVEWELFHDIWLD